MQEIKVSKKFALFMDWLEVNRPELGWAAGDTVAQVMKNNPSASFKTLAKMLAKITEEAEVIASAEEILGELKVESEVVTSEPEIIETAEVSMQNEHKENIAPVMSADEEAAIKAFLEGFEKQLGDTHIPNGKLDVAITQLAHKQASFAQRHPKTTVALTVGGVCLAGYGAYKLAKEYLL